MRVYKYSIVLSLLVSLIWTNIAEGQIGINIVAPSALNEFAPTVYFGEDSDHIQKWLDKHGGKTLEKDWIPGSNETRYVVYKVRLLEYWFGPYENAASQQSALSKLYQVMKDPCLNAKENHIFSFPLFLIPGKKMSTSKLAFLRDGTPFIALPAEAQKIEREIDKIIQQFKQVEVTELPADINIGMKELERLRQSLEDTGLTEGQEMKLKNLRDKHGTSANDGASGPFPASYSFAKWFATVVEILTEYFLPGELKRMAEKVVTLAYMIMPDVMDRIGSTLAKLQDAMVPDSVEDALDTVTEVARYAYQLYKDLRQVYDLVIDPEFNELLGELNLSGAAQHFEDFAQKYGMDMVNGFTSKLSKHFPYGDCISINMFSGASDPRGFEICMKEKIESEIVRKTEDLLQKGDIPGLKNLDVDAYLRLIKGKIDVSEFTKIQAQKIGCSELGKYGYESECGLIIDGEFRKSAVEVVKKEIRKRTGLDINHLQALAKALEDEDYEKAIKHATSLPYEKYKKQFGDYASLIKTLIDHPSLPGLRDLSLPAIGACLQQAIDAPAFNNAVLSSFSKVIQNHTGLSAIHVRGFLSALEDENFEQALRHVAEIPFERYQQHFGPYSDAVRSFIVDPNKKAFQGSALQAIDTFIGHLITDSKLKLVAKGSAELMQQAVQGKELNIKKSLKTILEGEYGWHLNTIEAFMNGNQRFSMEQMLKKAAGEMGITSPKALEAFGRGEIEKAIDYHIAFLKSQQLGNGGQIGLLKQKVKNRKEMLTILSSLFKQELDINQQQAQKLIYQNFAR